MYLGRENTVKLYEVYVRDREVKTEYVGDSKELSKIITDELLKNLKFIPPYSVDITKTKHKVRLEVDFFNEFDTRELTEEQKNKAISVFESIFGKIDFSKLILGKKYSKGFSGFISNENLEKVLNLYRFEPIY